MEEICHDGKVVGVENCDEGNNTRCCQTGCKGGFNRGYYQNSTNPNLTTCINNGADGIKVAEEECDDYNSITTDGCVNN